MAGVKGASHSGTYVLGNIPFTIFLFPALQANDPGNPALRQEHGRKRRGASRTGRRTKTPGAFLNDVDVGPEGVSPRDGTNNLQKVHGFIREITQGGIDY